MPTATIEAPTSQEPTAQAAISDAKKSDNVKGPSVAHALLQREAALVAKKAPPAESIVEAAKAAETAQSASDASDNKETPAPEAKEEAKAPAEAEDSEALSKSAIPPEVQKSIDKRIGKEIAKREALEAKLADLEARLADKPVEIPKPAPVEPTAANPLANVVDLPSLEKQLATAKETKLWVQEQLDRDDIDQGVRVGDRTYTKQELKAAYRNVERLLEVHIPERAKFLNQRSQSEKNALDTFDWLKDRDSDQYKAFVKVVSDPALGFSGAPNGIYAAAAAVEGQSQVQLRKAIAKDSQGTKPVEKKAPPASQLASSGAGVPPAREPGSSRQLAALSAEMAGMKKGHGVRVSDVTKFLSRRDQTHR